MNKEHLELAAILEKWSPGIVNKILDNPEDFGFECAEEDFDVINESQKFIEENYGEYV